MKAAILGNGPSRSAYNPSIKYDIRIGCNIPWTEVDYIMIHGPDMIELWNKDRNLITNPVFMLPDAWHKAKQLGFDEYLINNNLFLKEVHKKYTIPGFSCAHSAALEAIEEGYTELDIFGCDSAYENDGRDSYTRNYLTGRFPYINPANKWKKCWVWLINDYPNVTFNIYKSDGTFINYI